MKKLLQKKFYACLPTGMAVIVTAMLFSASTNAQIVYTDVNPDTTVKCMSPNFPCNKSYNLDLNNDGTIDFKLYSAWYTSPCLINTTKEVYISSQSGNGFYTLVMNANDVIDSNLVFSTSNVILRSITSDGSLVWNSCMSSSGSAFADRYLGLQLIVGANIYYGWVRLDVGVIDHPLILAQIILKDYAYNTIPNQPILAGQTVATGIVENAFASSIHLFPSPATNHLTIALGSNIKKVEVTIADITGKIIYSTTASDTQKIEVNTQDFAAGIYVVQIQTVGFIGTKKLVIEK